MPGKEEMISPLCRIFSVGETTAWAKQFLGKLQEDNIIEVTFEPSVDKYCKDMASVHQVPIVFVENSADSRKWIEKMRASFLRCYLVWYGRGFSKEDLLFAMEKRVYLVIDNARAEEPSVRKSIDRVSKAAGMQQDYDQIIHTIKAMLIEGDAIQGAEHFVSEIKTAVNKLEKCDPNYEFLTMVRESSGGLQKLPFHKNQDFGDALATVHELERTGVLLIAGQLPGQEGRIEFISGKIASAISGKAHGLKAIYRMFLWDDPKFAFTKKDPDEFQIKEDLNLSMKYIRMEGESLKKRFNSIRRELPPTNISLVLEPSSLHAGTRLSRDEFSTLASVVEFGKVSQVLDYNSLPDVKIYESLILLKRNSMIRVEV